MKKKNRSEARQKGLTDFQYKIQYQFEDMDLLDTALTHSSYARESKADLEDNERLEFLGDAYFDAVIGEALFKMYPEAEEGHLSKMRASIVCESSLANAARRLAVADYLLLGNGEDKNGGRERNSILADATEAIVGAIYLDGGYEMAKAFVMRAFAEDLEAAREGRFAIRDYKSKVQELIQANGIHEIRYVLEKEEGPDHDKTFTVRLEIAGKKISRGVGKSKKNAEQDAAKNAIERGKNAL